MTSLFYIPRESQARCYGSVLKSPLRNHALGKLPAVGIEPITSRKLKPNTHQQYYSVFLPSNFWKCPAMQGSIPSECAFYNLEMCEVFISPRVLSQTVASRSNDSNSDVITVSPSSSMGQIGRSHHRPLLRPTHVFANPRRTSKTLVYMHVGEKLPISITEASHIKPTKESFQNARGLHLLKSISAKQWPQYAVIWCQGGRGMGSGNSPIRIIGPQNRRAVKILLARSIHHVVKFLYPMKTSRAITHYFKEKGYLARRRFLGLKSSDLMSSISVYMCPSYWISLLYPLVTSTAKTHPPSI